MRIVGLVLLVLGWILLAEVLLSGFLRPLIDPGRAPALEVSPTQLPLPAGFIVVGLLLRRHRTQPNTDATGAGNGKG